MTSSIPPPAQGCQPGARIPPFTLTSDGLAGQVAALPEAATLALLLDSELVATTQAGPAGMFRFTLPPGALAGQLEVVDAATGLVLGAPVDLASARPIEWLGWRLEGGRIAGQFRLVPAMAATAILVQAFQGDLLVFQAVALPLDGTHRFQAWLHTLPQLGASWTLHPCLNRLQLDHPLHVDVASIGLAGCLDSSSHSNVNGWALDLADPARAVPIEIRLNHAPIGMVTPNLARPDLTALGLPGDACGFDLPFPPGTPTSRTTTVQAFVAGTGLQLAGSPYKLAAMPPAIKGVLDLVGGKHMEGWAFDECDIHHPLRIEALCNGEVVGTGLADRDRPDLLQAGLPSGTCGFRIRLDRPLATLLGQPIAARVAGQPGFLGNSPKIFQRTPATRFLTRASLPAPMLQRLARRLTERTAALRLSILLPVRSPDQARLGTTLAAIQAQWSRNWELVCIDNGAGGPAITALLEAASAQDPRIRCLSHASPRRSAMLNAGLGALTGDYTLVLGPSDRLEPDAVYRLLRTAIRTGADILYGDNALTTDDPEDVVELEAWPAFSLDYALGRPGILDSAATRTALVRAAGGWNDTLDEGADFDFILRALAQASTIAHLPGIILRRPLVPAEILPARTEAEHQILVHHLAAAGRGAVATPGLVPGEFRVDWPDDGGEILVVIPTRDRLDLLQPCLDSLHATAQPAAAGRAPPNLRVVVIDHESAEPATAEALARLQPPHAVMRYEGPFNFAHMNNLAVRQHAGNARYLLFLNNDVTATAPGWLQRLRSLVARPDTGAAAPLLLYPGNTVQHAGVLLGFGGGADHVMRGRPAILAGRRLPGYLGNLTAVRDYSALTAACMMVRRDLFDQLGGFDEAFVVAFNDTDLCLRIAQSGHRLVYDGHTVLYHHESATRGAGAGAHKGDDDRLRGKWPQYVLGGDPFYNPLLTIVGADHQPRPDPACRKASARVVTLRHPVDAPPALNADGSDPPT